MVEELRLGHLSNSDISGTGHVHWIKNICRLGHLYPHELVSEPDVYAGNWPRNVDCFTHFVT